ncbi:MAG TPA: hypothetical protein VFS71_07045, partial [Flavobacterium sp.]|uniref:hypothetical protein n=1 Tax=Flavobacterium sp. TaxID=239 RepID=UPI002DB7E25D
MMWSLSKRYGSKPVSAAENRSKGYQIGHKYYLVIQDKWARKMSSVTLGLSKRKLICLLGLFLILTTSACFYIISESLSNRTKS